MGLRPSHYSFIESHQPDIPWFEILSDNYFCDGGLNLFYLEKIIASYPVTLHGVGMSLGSIDPINVSYLKKLKKLIDFTSPVLVSDHLCWTSFNGNYFPELLPLPYTEEAVFHIASRIHQIQNELQRKIMIENVSTYLTFNHSTMTEWEFLQSVANEADCLILLDINNIFVSAHNNQFDPLYYLTHISPERIAQFHLGGYENQQTHLFDSHSMNVHPPVWQLFEEAIRLFGPVPTSIERDNDIPDFLELAKETKKAAKIMEKYALTV